MLDRQQLESFINNLMRTLKGHRREQVALSIGSACLLAGYAIGDKLLPAWRRELPDILQLALYSIGSLALGYYAYRIWRMNQAPDTPPVKDRPSAINLLTEAREDWSLEQACLDRKPSGHLGAGPLERVRRVGTQLVENITGRPARVHCHVELDDGEEHHPPLGRSEARGLTGGFEALLRGIDAAEDTVEDHDPIAWQAVAPRASESRRSPCGYPRCSAGG